MEKLKDSEVKLVSEILKKHRLDRLPELEIIASGENIELEKCHDIRCAIADEFAEKGMDATGLNEYGLELKGLLDKMMGYALKE